MGIITSKAWVTLYGNNFSPHHLVEQTGLLFSEVIERGVTVLPTGRYRGQPAPYGCCVSEAVPLIENETIEDRLLILLDMLYSRIGNRLDDFRIDWIEVNLLVKHNGDGQHGYGLESKLLLVIGQLGANLSISYEGLT